jgi:hypothetical protein
MDEELTLHELRRLEAERKLRTIPAQVLDAAWARDAQIEAVIDAVLAVTYAGNATAYAHARQVGEWCARIATALPYGPEPSFARRAGVLADVDPVALERIAELKHYAACVREYQLSSIEDIDGVTTIAMIVAAADEFDGRIGPDSRGYVNSPGAALRAMMANASNMRRPVIEALSNAARPSRNTHVA